MQNIELYTHDGQRKYLTPSERDHFITQAKTLGDLRQRTFCLTLAYSGCRISEGLALNYQNIDIDAGQILLKTLKKRANKIRAVPVPPGHLEMLDLVHNIKVVQKQPQKAKDRLWPVTRMTGYRWVIRAMQLAGISGAMARPHGLRHAFGAQAAMHDIPLPLIQRWMGHSDLETTSIYLQLVGNEEKSFAGRMWQN